MKDELLRLLQEKEGYNIKLNTIREYLQAFILRILFKNNFFQHAAFLGGTCLRFVYRIKRFSEDLDFALQMEEGFHFEKIIDRLKIELQDSGYLVTSKIKKDGVYSAMIKFSELLWEAGMSGRKEENFSIKIEVDRRPPEGNQTQNQIIDRYFTAGITCFDLPTLFAGKINAVLTRNYVKGRDYYDLFWYLTAHKGIQPNIGFLKNALFQFRKDEKVARSEAKNWKPLIIEMLESIDWNQIQKEVEILIEDREELMLFTKDNLRMLLENIKT
jgi:predicted nucleotidyltransferase component of viral defense system